MEGLVIVHADGGYLDPRNVGEEVANRDRVLFNRIADESQDYLDSGNRVYFLAGESNATDSRVIPVRFRGQISHPGMFYFPASRTSSRDGVADPAEEQFLCLRERLILDGFGNPASHGNIAITGVSYDACVNDLHNLLIGRNMTAQNMVNYLDASKSLGWTLERFKKVFGKELPAEINEDLTDKGFPQF